LGQYVDDLDRELLALLQRDASQPYAALGRAVGLSPGAAHERVRKLRERGVIRRTTIEVDPAAVGRGVLAFVMVRASAWMGDQRTRDDLAALPEVQEAHVVAGSAALLLKVRTTSTASLQGILRRIFKIDGVASTEAVVVLETFFERPTDPTERAELGEKPGQAGWRAEQATAAQRAR
jgi:Lrp/AsnC family transcriptional regulator, leucine-responsive regulatory protein